MTDEQREELIKDCVREVVNKIRHILEEPMSGDMMFDKFGDIMSILSNIYRISSAYFYTCVKSTLDVDIPYDDFMEACINDIIFQFKNDKLLKLGLEDTKDIFRLFAKDINDVTKH